MNARYALDYVLDSDGVWKICQFTISPLPRDWDRLRAKRGLSQIPKPTVSPPRSMLLTSDSDSRDESVAEPQFDPEQRLQPMFPPKVTEKQVRQWFSEWNNAMATGDPKVVANRYSMQAVMMSTMSLKPKTTRQEILEFYQLFLWNRPQTKVLETFVTISTHWCKDFGILEYTFRDISGPIKRVKERYSFLYIFDEASGWKSLITRVPSCPKDYKKDPVQSRITTLTTLKASSNF